MYLHCVGCPLLHQRAKKKYVTAIALLLLHSPVSIARIQHSGRPGLILSKIYQDFLDSRSSLINYILFIIVTLSCLHTTTFGQNSRVKNKLRAMFINFWTFLNLQHENKSKRSKILVHFFSPLL